MHLGLDKHHPSLTIRSKSSLLPKEKIAMRCNPPKTSGLIIIQALLLLLLAAPQVLASDEKLPRGVLIEKVVCQNDATQSYALYLPSNYTPQKKWPVIYAFDPSAQGNAPVELYKEAAEKYGYIVAGSYNSRNGMQPVPLQTAIVSMINDTRQRLSIDELRIYTTGFSGGARVATRIASSCGGCVAGVIACGAGFPTDLTPKADARFVYFATVGIDDYNFPELKRLDEKLSALNLPHRVATFAGRHEWPSSKLLGEAVEWMELQAMRAGRRERDVALLESLWKQALERARADEASGNFYEAYVGYAALVSDFKTLRDVAEQERKSLALKEMKEVKQAIKDEQEQLQKQQELTGQMLELGRKLLTEPSNRAGTLKELRAIIETLRKQANEPVDSGERRIARRSLRQVQAQTYEAAVHNYHPQKQYDVAIVNLEVAAEVTNASPYILYELARALTLAGEKKKALETLKRAVEKGLKDFSILEQQKDFDAIRQEDDFKAIIQSLKNAPPSK
jgi:dienelactone hydrolase